MSEQAKKPEDSKDVKAAKTFEGLINLLGDPDVRKGQIERGLENVKKLGAKFALSAEKALQDEDLTTFAEHVLIGQSLRSHLWNLKRELNGFNNEVDGLNNEMPGSEEQRVKDRFKNHVATLKDGVLTWADSDRRLGAYNFTFQIVGNFLCATGHLVCAVYKSRRPNIGLNVFSNTSVDGFAGNCVASPHGKGFQFFDQELMEEQLTECFEELREAHKEGDIKLCDDWEQLVEKAWRIVGNSNGRDLLRENEAFMSMLFNEPEDWQWVHELGMRVDFHCHMHLRGLQMAMAQINEAEDWNECFECGSKITRNGCVYCDEAVTS